MKGTYIVAEHKQRPVLKIQLGFLQAERLAAKAFIRRAAGRGWPFAEYITYVAILIDVPHYQRTDAVSLLGRRRIMLTSLLPRRRFALA